MMNKSIQKKESKDSRRQVHTIVKPQMSLEEIEKNLIKGLEKSGFKIKDNQTKNKE